MNPEANSREMGYLYLISRFRMIKPDEAEMAPDTPPTGLVCSEKL